MARVPNQPIASGVVVIRRAAIAEVEPNTVIGRQFLAIRFDHRGPARRLVARTAVVDRNGTAQRAAFVYRQFGNRGGALKLVGQLNLPNLPISGGAPELVVVVEHWLRTEQGIAARAFARVTAGDLGDGAITLVQCVTPPNLAFRAISLPDGTVETDGNRLACAPLGTAEPQTPPAPSDEMVPVPTPIRG